jgi:hypothetical protein
VPIVPLERLLHTSNSPTSFIVHQFETQELAYLLVCCGTDKGRRALPSTCTHTHTGRMTGAAPCYLSDFLTVQPGPLWSTYIAQKNLPPRSAPGAQSRIFFSMTSCINFNSCAASCVPHALLRLHLLLPNLPPSLLFSLFQPSFRHSSHSIVRSPVILVIGVYPD